MGSKELDATAAAPPQSIQVNLGCTNNCFNYVFGFGRVSLHCCSRDFSGCGGHGVLSSFRGENSLLTVASSLVVELRL